MLTLCLPAAGIQEEAVAIREGEREDGGRREDKQPTVHHDCCSDTFTSCFTAMGHFPITGTRVLYYILLCSPIYVVGHRWKAQGTILLSNHITALPGPFLFLFPLSPFPRPFSSIYLGLQLAPLAFSLGFHRQRCRLGRCDECLRALRTALRCGLSLLCNTKRHRGPHSINTTNTFCFRSRSSRRSLSVGLRKYSPDSSCRSTCVARQRS